MSLHIVGTSFHQVNLEMVFEYESENNNPNKIKCELMAEPSNLHDPNAIRVVYRGKCKDLQGVTLAYVKKEETFLHRTPKTVYIQIYYNNRYSNYCTNVIE